MSDNDIAWNVVKKWSQMACMGGAFQLTPPDFGRSALFRNRQH
jgi:hypothetical protein